MKPLKKSSTRYDSSRYPKNLFDHCKLLFKVGLVPNRLYYTQEMIDRCKNELLAEQILSE